jgi:palmitoyl-protein thioesterase
LNDTVVTPKETAWFEYYEAGNEETVVPLQQSPLYSEDWIGLKSLMDGGKVDLVASLGAHLSHLDLTDDLVQRVRR